MDQPESKEEKKNTPNNLEHDSKPTTCDGNKEVVADCSQSKGDNKQKISNWTDRIQSAATVCLVFITFFYALFAYYQVCEMRKATVASTEAASAATKAANIAAATLTSSGITVNKTLAEMKTQSDAMKKNAEATINNTILAGKSFNATQDQFRLEQRAWVAADNIRLHKDMNSTENVQIDYSIKNTGKSPALRIKNAFEIHVKGLDTQDSVFKWVSKEEISLAPGTDYAFIARRDTPFS